MSRKLYCGVELSFRIPNVREFRLRQECEKCMNSCTGQFVDDKLKDCINFIPNPKKISVEEKYLQRMFGRK